MSSSPSLVPPPLSTADTLLPFLPETLLPINPKAPTSAPTQSSPVSSANSMQYLYFTPMVPPSLSSSEGEPTQEPSYISQSKEHVLDQSPREAPIISSLLESVTSELKLPAHKPHLTPDRELLRPKTPSQDQIPSSPPEYSIPRALRAHGPYKQGGMSSISQQDSKPYQSHLGGPRQFSPLAKPPSVKTTPSDVQQAPSSIYPDLPQALDLEDQLRGLDGLDFKDLGDQHSSSSNLGLDKQRQSRPNTSTADPGVGDFHAETGSYDQTQQQDSVVPILESRPSSTLPSLQVPHAPLLQSKVCHLAAQVILRQIHQGLSGYTDQQHQFQDFKHDTESYGNHSSLDATYAGAEAFSTHIGLPHQQSLHYHPTKRSLANQGVDPRTLAPSASSLSSLFTGTADTLPQPRNICLHLEQPPQSFPQASSDVDSLIAFPTSLAVIQTEFYYCPTPQYKRHITTNLHLQRQIYYPSEDGPDKHTTLNLRDIPHIYLGSVTGIHDCSVYAFLPRMYFPGEFKSLTDIQITRFTNVVLQSISQHVPDATTQHLPPSFQASQFNSAAQANEMRTGAQDSTSRTHPTYVIQALYLEAIWDSIQSQCIGPELLEYSDAFLCIMSKGHKLQFQGQDLFLEVMQTFYTRIITMFNFNFLSHDEIYIDIAVEVTPSLATYTLDGPCNAQVYLLRQCCLEKSLEALYQDETPGGVTQYYYVKFLAQACNLTHVPAKKSQIFQGGLRYLQCYAVEKEISDAGTVYPFSNPSLPELCLDPVIWASAASAARYSGKRSRQTLVEAYFESKSRVRCAYRDSRGKSFGVRTEYRITSTLLLAMLDLCHTQQVDGALTSILPRWQNTPPFVWAVDTLRYTSFVLGNVHKICATIEAIILSSPQDGIRQAPSYLIYGLLQCLRFFFSRAALDTQPTLWYNRHVGADGRLRCGLGFETTLPATGYCWFLPVVDWDRFQLREDIYPYFVVNPAEILGFNWKTREARNAAWKLDDVLDCLPGAAAHPKRLQAIVLLICHLCLRQYRQDVLLLLAKECFLNRDEIQSIIEDDGITFCYQDLSKYFGDLYLTKGNRAKISRPSHMFEALWTDSDTFNRTYFREKSYRTMFRKASLALKPYPEVCGWEKLFTREFFTFHSVVPLPDGNGTLISTAKDTGKRAWWSVAPGLQGAELVWGRGKYRKSNIQAYPETLSMSKAQLEVYLSRI